MLAKLQPFFNENLIEAGCDEAGRGCLAGPVFAAAVILPRDFSHPLINDSKKLSEHQRVEARVIVQQAAMAWAVAFLTPEEIDHHNILRASFLAMHRAIDQLAVRPESLLIDGNRFIPYQDLPFHCMIKGDGKYASIAAASILAKTFRDEYMTGLSADFPHYGWAQNKGYPTEVHREAIRIHRPCIHQRRSFRLLPDAVQGNLF